ncbi:MAG TPA: hypothetical protein VHH34_21200 [Pseudonocardiaceae bacterium]|nr:hypothetical protein [Pseudonocardiaceae bacterium]
MSAPRRRVDHTRTSRIVLTGLWADAVLVMAASAWNGGRALAALGDPFGFGVLLGFAVDVGLAVALVGDRALHLAGRVEPWGRALRIITALMSLALNCAVAAWLGHTGLAVFHAFLPVLLILLSEYAQSSTLQFGEIAAEHAAAVQAEQDAKLAEERAAWETEQAQRAAERREREGAEQAIRDERRRDQEAEAARRRESAEQERVQREHQQQQLAGLLAAQAVLGARLSQPRPQSAPGARQRHTPARARSTRQARRQQTPDLARLVEQARPLVLGEGLGRSELARRLRVSEHWARRVIEQLHPPQQTPATTTRQGETDRRDDEGMAA